ncbi:helix-turn-helix domain-containing protein [Microbacteriaceae bacterium VKM Ac-2854]|nr:helix-turn-helix domain-containing protein [Microbacteriaceae bacterium VKM Ac-2854]
MQPARSPLAEFLRARRELLQPEEVGLPRDENRRVPGLRREEVARRAGISPEYYLRLEQGRDHQPSAQVLGALSRALDLDEDARAYLHRLAHPAPNTRRPRIDAVEPAVLQLLQRMSDVPAYISDRNHDVLAVNPLAAALAPGYLLPGTNLLLAVVELGPDAHAVEDWAETTRRLVAALRHGSEPGDPRLQEIVETLSIRSPEFRRLWAAHDARPQTSGFALHLIPPHGWVRLRWQSLQVPGGSGHALTSMLAEPGSEGERALRELARRVDAERSAAPRLRLA